MFKKRKIHVKIPLIEIQENINYSSSLKMDLVNKFRRIIPLLIPKKNGFYEIGLMFFVTFLHTLLLSNLKIRKKYRKSVWLDFHTFGRFVS